MKTALISLLIVPAMMAASLFWLRWSAGKAATTPNAARTRIQVRLISLEPALSCPPILTRDIYGLSGFNLNMPRGRG